MFVIDYRRPLRLTKFDIIIANPPYSKLGAEITHNMLNTVDFKQYINLLPANDYRRGKDDLYQYVKDGSMVPINVGEFKDASVTTHLCELNKIKNSLSVAEFEISNYIDRSLDRYFLNNLKKEETFKVTTLEEGMPLDCCVYFGKMDVCNGHLPYKRNTFSYKLNNNLMSWEDVLKDKQCLHYDYVNNGAPYFSGNVVIFDTVEEKNNFIKFVYHTKEGFQFISKIFTAINADHVRVTSKYIPRVDWKKPWTIASLLKEYDYTDEMIIVIKEDLTNFRYLED